MHKNEFLLRFSMINGKKSAKFKLCEFPIEQDFDENDVLKKLNLTEVQTQQFYYQNIESSLAWLNEETHFLIGYHDKHYPELLKQISCPPLVLFVCGNLNLLNTPQIAMVGSRQFSEYGAQWARYFASELATNGLTITSGLALGIDALCHRGALDVSGNTIAVLGSGLAHITPKTNHYLAKDILANNGAIISEFHPDERARAEYFPRRNRIISGLSLGTFVLEASKKSGSLITARYAIEHNRDVFALPGEIANENSDGTHWLIKQGAYLVTKPTDILEHYSGSLAWIKTQHNQHEADNLAIIHPDIFAIIHNKAISVDMIADKTGQSISDITIKLMELELEGLIKTVIGGYIRDQCF